MDRWRRQLQQSITETKEIAKRFDIPAEELEGLEKIFKIKITPYYLSLIKKKGDPIYKQVVPDARELIDHGLFEDPLAG